MKSRSLLLEAPRRLRWVDQELSPPGPNQVALRTLWGAVSIGTELALIGGRHRGSRPVQYPRMTGYESYAEVVALGPGVDGLSLGERVVAVYGHRSAALVSTAGVIPVAAAIAPELALLAILSCDAAKGIGRLGASHDDRVLATGMGTLGLLALFGLAQRGSAVDAVEPLQHRRELATALGARRSLEPAEAELLPNQYSRALECSGSDRAFGLLQAKLRPGGTVCVLSDGNHEPLVLRPQFHENELRVVGSSDGEDYRAHAAWFLPRAQTAAATLCSLFESTVEANDLADVLLSVANSKRPPLKILVRYSGQNP